MPRSHPHRTSPFPPLPQSFISKKTHILESLSVPEDLYSDKSPKGSVDAPIVDFINEINAIDGLVTTSSCSGRVAVFVEGPTVPFRGRKEGINADEDDGGEQETKAVTGSPAGKGGGYWLYVSHDPVVIPQTPEPGFFTRLCGLSEPGDTAQSSDDWSSFSTSRRSGQMPRLVKLSFSPLILHVHCATLAHAKPLLAASINAGFRESGVQSLRALDEPDAGVTIGIRTAGLGFETVVGMVCEDDKDGDRNGGRRGGERYKSVASEEYLAAMFDVINGRFEWNDRRKQRLRMEIRKGFKPGSEWEDIEARRRRKREEGLRRQKERKEVIGKDGVEARLVAGVEAEEAADEVQNLFEENAID